MCVCVSAKRSAPRVCVCVCVRSAGYNRSAERPISAERPHKRPQGAQSLPHKKNALVGTCALVSAVLRNNKSLNVVLVTRNSSSWESWDAAVFV